MAQQPHGLGLVVSLALLMCVNAEYLRPACIPPPIPAPFRNFLVYTAHGIYDPLKEPLPNGCLADDAFIFGGLCSGGKSAFYQKVMNFTEREFAVEEGKAREFFLGRLGLDAEGLSEQGRVLFFPWMMDPRRRYTAFVFSGECVPSEGYEVRDGGFAVAGTDPEGVELGGEFVGQKLPLGAMVIFGFYNIRITGPNAREEVIRYRSLTPLIPLEEPSPGNCELEHPVWGEGLAQVLTGNEMLGDGKIQAVMRNVLTFPPLGNP